MADPRTPQRPYRAHTRAALDAELAQALARGDGRAGAEAIHELWWRGEIGARIDEALARLWRAAAGRIPDWLPMRYVETLPTVYEVAARCRAARSGRHHVYLVLLDYADRPQGPFGFYVGMTAHSPTLRFEQHKAGIRASGSVLKRGLELLSGPVAHLARISRGEATRIEEELAEALRAAGLLVRGGH